MCTPPLRELTPETSLGYSVIAFAALIGLPLFPWQQALMIRALELRQNGQFRFRYVLLLVARQNGKSTVCQVLALWAIYVLRIGMVVGTAQNLDLAEEIWETCVTISEAIPELADGIKRVNRVNGRKSLDLKPIPGERTGSRYKVKPANRKTRGLSGDLILLDELREHTNWDAWSAVTKTTTARRNAQVWCMSNAGDVTAIVLEALRLKAHAALGDPDGAVQAKQEQASTADGAQVDHNEAVANDSLAVFEWSAAPSRNKWDREGWAEANPSLGYTLTEDALASSCATDPDATFRTENLCQWVPELDVGPISEEAWDQCADPTGEIPDEAPITYAVDVDHDRKAAYIAVCGIRADGRPQVEIAVARTGPSWLEWVPELFRDLAQSGEPVRVVVQANGCPAAALVEPLQAIPGLTVVEWSGRNLAIAAGKFADYVHAADPNTPGKQLPPLAHRGQEVLTAGVKAIRSTEYGDGWLWSRRSSRTAAGAVCAATAALWDQLTNQPPQSIYETTDSLYET